MKKVLLLLLFGFVFNMAQAKPPFENNKDKLEKIVTVKGDVTANVLFADAIKNVNSLDFSENTYVVKINVSEIDTTKFIRNGMEYMIIYYVPITEPVNDKNLDTTRCYKPNSIEFMRTIKALRKIPDSTEIIGSAGGLSASY